MCWRAVEAQHHVSTWPLVDSLAEQALLENLLDKTKPPVPAECRHLDYLLSTPFRYGAYPKGSRFRRAGMTEGVFYAAEAPVTAIAELAFYRLLFFAESPRTPWPSNATDYTVFAAAFGSMKAVDLGEPPFAAARKRWLDPLDYSACQELSQAARKSGIELIRYASARDPEGGMNLALLTCRAFEKPKPVRRQTWHMQVSAYGVRAICEAPKLSREFDRAAFAADPRIAALAWER